MTRKEFRKYIHSLNDFELYNTVKKYLINRLSTGQTFEWKFDIMYEVCNQRHADIYNSALEDAEIIRTTRNSSINGVNVSDIFRPSLMSRLELSNILLLNKSNVRNSKEITDTNELNKLMNSELGNFLFCKVTGDSMVDEGILDKDLLIVDTGTVSYRNKIIVASVNGILFVKRYKIIEGKHWLYSSNKKYSPVQIDTDMDIKIVGVVKMILKRVS